jgi:hypothetical protein
MKNKMKDLRAELERNMNGFFKSWVTFTTLGAIVFGPIGGLFGSGTILGIMYFDLKKFDKEKYAPALAKAKKDCKKQLGIPT